MNLNYRRKTLSMLLMVVLTTAGCGAGRDAYKRGTKAEVAKNYEAALDQYRQALALDPGNIDYKLKYEQTRFTAAFDHFQKGRERGRGRTRGGQQIGAQPSRPLARFQRSGSLRTSGVIKSRSQNQPEPILISKAAAANSTSATSALRCRPI
jgi:tetratricopeptide (TPR) repeat protein